MTCRPDDLALAKSGLKARPAGAAHNRVRRHGIYSRVGQPLSGRG